MQAQYVERKRARDHLAAQQYLKSNKNEQAVSLSNFSKWSFLTSGGSVCEGLATS